MNDLTVKYNNKGIDLTWFGHSTIRVNIGHQRFYFDPIRRNKILRTILEPEKEKNVTAIFISHEHWDHCDDKTVKQLSNLVTRIIGPQEALNNFFFPSMTYEFDTIQEMDKYFTEKKAYVHHAKVGDINDFETCSVKCLAASEGLSFLFLAEKKILFMGDSVATDEMIKETPDVVLFPIWAIKGEEADLDTFLQLAKDALCIPMHYHTSEKGFSNFYIQKDKIESLLPETIDMKIMNRGEPFVL